MTRADQARARAERKPAKCTCGAFDCAPTCAIQNTLDDYDAMARDLLDALRFIEAVQSVYEARFSIRFTTWQPKLAATLTAWEAGASE